MDAPFIYSKYVTGKDFIGRKQDCQILGNLIRQSEAIALYSPPKCGKSSLIQQALFQLRMSGFPFSVGQMTLLNIRTEEAFLCRLGSTAIRSVASSPAEYDELVREFLGETHFVFDRRLFAREDRILSTSWDLDEADVDAILSLPQRLAEHSGQQLVLILDAFSDIDLIDGGDRLIARFEELLRQRRKGCTFLLTGSAYNAMREIFDVRKDFFRLVERFRMRPFEEKEVVDHLTRGFLSGGKVVDRNLLTGVCRLFRGHLWYINHFAAICNAMSKGYILEPLMIEALDCLLSIHEPRFIATMDGLTTFQVGLLRAVIDGHTKFSTAEVVARYGLNSSANVKRLKDALVRKEVLTFGDDDEPRILDPLFEYWVKKYFFEINE